MRANGLTPGRLRDAAEHVVERRLMSLRSAPLPALRILIVDQIFDPNDLAGYLGEF